MLVPYSAFVRESRMRSELADSVLCSNTLPAEKTASKKYRQGDVFLFLV